jgi:hypothetical protein
VVRLAGVASPPGRAGAFGPPGRRGCSTLRPSIPASHGRAVYRACPPKDRASSAGQEPYGPNAPARPSCSDCHLARVTCSGEPQLEPRTSDKLVIKVRGHTVHVESCEVQPGGADWLIGAANGRLLDDRMNLPAGDSTQLRPCLNGFDSAHYVRVSSIVGFRAMPHKEARVRANSASLER